MTGPERGSLKNYETQTLKETEFRAINAGTVGRYATEFLIDYEKADAETLTQEEYEHLLVKEYAGELTQEEFDQLLHFEFQQSLEDNLPIQENFSPEEELAAIKHLPKGEKREALADFKDKLVRQRKAWATCQRFIERSIEFDHDVPKEKLNTLISIFGMEYGFDVEHIDIAEELIEGYYEKRQKALDMREKFPDDRELVSQITGVTFEKDEQFDVTVGPMSIDIGMSGENVGKIKEAATGEAYDDSEWAVGGFCGVAKGGDVHFIAINQDLWTKYNLENGPSYENLVKHEHQHLKNQLFRRVFESQKSQKALGIESENYKDEEDINKIIIENVLDNARADAYEQVKDEITAMLQNEDIEVLQADLEELFLKNEDSAYNYLGNIRKLEIGDTLAEKELFKETAERMLVKEYHAAIKNAVNSFAELEETGYSTQEASALLNDKPLDEWPKAAKRLLEPQK